MHDAPDLTLEFRDLLAGENDAAFQDWIERHHPRAAADLLALLDDELLWAGLQRVPETHRAEVFSHLELDRQVRLAEHHPTDGVAALVQDMAPDDRVDLIKGLGGGPRQRLLAQLDEPVRRDVEQLAIYAEGTAGALMSTEVATLRADQTVGAALQTLRAMAARKETIYYNYVVDAVGKLLGIVSLRDLVLAHPETKLSELMNPNVIAAWVDDDQEDVARQIREYDLLALPILHGDHRLAGVVTVDDALDVSSEEATEDFQRMASVGIFTTGLRDAGIWLLYRKRIPWLLGLVFVNIFSGAGIAYFEDTIAAHVALVFFLPLLIDSGGNAGSQSATLMIRALALGDVRMRDWFRLGAKELGVALAIGLTMGIGVSLVGVVRAPEVTVVVAMTMVITVMIGSLIGMSLPFVLTRFNLDPATASAPLITSIADIAGVVVYFSIATWYLGTLAGDRDVRTDVGAALRREVVVQSDFHPGGAPRLDSPILPRAPSMPLVLSARCVLSIPGHHCLEAIGR